MKLEIRNPKSETNPKLERRKRRWRPRDLVSRFEFRICFGFRYSDFGFLLLLLATPAGAQDAPSDAPAPATLAELAAEGPAVAAALEMDRSTPAGKLRAVVTLIDLGADEAAARILPELVEADINPAAQAALVREFGPAAFLKLIRLDRGDRPEFAGARNFAQACLDAAATEARNPQQIAALVADLGVGDAAKRQAAMVDLRGRGTAGIAGLFTALAGATADARELRSSILETLVEMRPALDEPLVAGLAEGSGQFQRDLADLAGQQNVTDAALWLAALAAAEPPSPAGQIVRNMIASRGLALSSPDQVAQAVRRRLAELKSGVPGRDLDDESSATWWTWDQKTKTLASRQVDASQLRVLAGARLLDAAATAGYLDPELARQLAAYRLQRAGILERDAAELLKPLETMPIAELSDTLAEAVVQDQFFAAAKIAAELGKRKDFSALVTLDGRPSPLAAAVASPNRELKFAALSAVMEIDPQTSFAGASHVGEALWYFAAGGGRPAAIVASSQNGVATDWAGKLRAAGFAAEPTISGIDAIRAAVDSRYAGRLALVVFDSDLGSPGVGDFLYQLRTYPEAQRVPVAVFASLYRYPDAERWAAADKWTLAAVRPVDAEGVKAVVERALALAPPLASEEERSAQATKALAWLGKLLTAGKPYDELPRGAGIAATMLLGGGDATKPALAILAQVGTHDAQAALVDAAGNAALPISVRKAAVDALETNLKTHPLQLTRAEVLLQYDRYNGSETADAETQQALGRVLDLIEKK